MKTIFFPTLENPSKIMHQTKLLFIDSNVENYNYLISQVYPQTKVVILQANQNGIDQISHNLDQYQNIDTVHIISHGARGTLYLGNSILSLENIHLYVESIQQWAKYLSADGEILIYGCQVASGKEGRKFIRQLHQLTKANIAASETLTGNLNRGGNWNLEVIFGQFKSALAFTPEVRASYPGVLANILVNTTDDVVDDSDGVTSLREAIIEANSTPQDDTIQLTGGTTYNLTISGSDEDAAAIGDLDIVAGSGEITIISEGEEKAVIDAGGAGEVENFAFFTLDSGINDRIFHVLEDATLELDNIEITGGFITDASGGGGIYNSGTLTINNSTISGNLGDLISSGGGIYNIGTANISDSTISDNLADGGAGIVNRGTANISNSIINNNSGFSSSGGGIVNSLGTISIIDSTISGNTSSFAGGVLNYSGTANIRNSTISNNSASVAGGGIINSSGTANIRNSTISNNSASATGGIINYLGTANISNSTISGNSAVSGGGGIANTGGTANISNSTISGNSSYGGGGIYNSGTAIISNSTITGNEAPSDLGSGILQTSKPLSILDESGNYTSYIVYGNATVTSSIISGNVNSDIDSVDSNQILISGDHNLIGTGNAINEFNGENDQINITNPRLRDLADNGGSTFTHLPRPNSPTIDAGSNPDSLTTDQRGEARFVDEGVDIGAVEVQTPQEITGTPESETLNGAGDNDTIKGLAGNDTINGRSGDDQIIGNRGNDFLVGKDGNDTLEGRQGSDRLFGGNGNDSLLGGQGRDFLNGGAGDDTLTGGGGIDRFIFNTNQEFTPEDLGVDTIADFVPEQDKILLNKSTFTAITSESGTGFSVNAEFDIVTSDIDAETSKAVIVYNSENGKLFYNANGTEAEFGGGGEFANLTNLAAISEGDFLLRG